MKLCPLEMPQSGSGPKFGPRFGGSAEPNCKFGSGFGQGRKSLDLAEHGSNQTFFNGQRERVGGFLQSLES